MLGWVRRGGMRRLRAWCRRTGPSVRRRRDRSGPAAIVGGTPLRQRVGVVQHRCLVAPVRAAFGLVGIIARSCTLQLPRSSTESCPSPYVIISWTRVMLLLPAWHHAAQGRNELPSACQAPAWQCRRLCTLQFRSRGLISREHITKPFQKIEWLRRGPQTLQLLHRCAIRALAQERRVRLVVVPQRAARQGVQHQQHAGVDVALRRAQLPAHELAAHRCEGALLDHERIRTEPFLEPETQ